MGDPEAPEFGPGGYLPPRAAKRARKIVLRAPLGLQWIVGSLVVGVLVVIAGVWWLTADASPQEPWVAVGPAADVDGAASHEELDVLLVGNGRIRAFAEADQLELTYCPESRRIEAPDGRVWTLTGRGQGTPSLQEHPVRIHDEVLYVDPTRTTSAPPAAGETAEPTCLD